MTGTRVWVEIKTQAFKCPKCYGRTVFFTNTVTHCMLCGWSQMRVGVKSGRTRL